MAAAEHQRALAATLLTRQWRDRPEGVELSFWAASDEGPVKLRFTGQEAVMFIDRVTTGTRARRKALELQTLAGRPVDALYFRSQRDLVVERARIRDDLGLTFEGNVKPHDRFLMERFITGAAKIVGTPTPRLNGRYLEFENPRLQAHEHSARLGVLALDIETDGFEGPLLSIACAGIGGDRVWVRGQADEVESDADYEIVPDERALLEAFLAHVEAADPDILAGWNVIDFDLKYLEHKAGQLGVEFRLGRGRARAKVLPPRNDRQPHVARIPGRVVLDGIATLRAATYAFESFRLEDVAQTLLGRGKKIEHGGDPVAEIRRLFNQDKAALATYNLEDCRLVLDIFEAADLVGFALERQALTGLPMDRQGGSVAAFDNLYLPRLHRRGYVAPDLEDVGEFVASPGGFVMESAPGLYRNVLVLDFKSLYPSIILSFAIDPLGLAVPGEDPVPGFEGGLFAREGHILPGLIDGLWAARDEAKRRQDAARSRAIKILMNSFYGVLGSGGCRFFSPKLASSITLRGHQIIQDSRSFIEGCGLEVIYGDTDSLFVHVGDAEPEACQAVGHKLARELNDYWTTRLRDELNLASRLEIEFETHYLRFLMPTMRGSDKGTKKRYAGSIKTNKGPGLVIKGLEAARTDWTPLARRVQRELLARVFADEAWRPWLIDLAQDLRAGQLDRELVYRKRIRRRLEDYEKNVPPHIQAARKLGTQAREIRYVITTRGPEPVQLARGPLDYEHYLTRQLAPAVDCVLPFLGTSFAKVAGSQLRLFE